jgi:hypothetical protein
MLRAGQRLLPPPVWQQLYNEWTRIALPRAERQLASGLPYRCPIQEVSTRLSLDSRPKKMMFSALTKGYRPWPNPFLPRTIHQRQGWFGGGPCPIR